MHQHVRTSLRYVPTVAMLNLAALSADLAASKEQKKCSLRYCLPIYAVALRATPTVVCGILTDFSLESSRVDTNICSQRQDDWKF